MGQQVSSLPQKILPCDTVDSLQFEIKKQAQISLGNRQPQLRGLPEVSRRFELPRKAAARVPPSSGGTDSSVLWKGTVRIACVKIDPSTKKIECYQAAHSLKQFLQVFRTFQTNLHAMVTVETQRIRSATNSPTHSSTTTSTGGPNSGASSCAGSFDKPDLGATTSPRRIGRRFPPAFQTCRAPLEPDCNECCICLERKPEVSLPCAHSYCTPCIEQWNIHQKKCPICDEELASTDGHLGVSEMPEAEEISEEICATLMKLSVDK
ncbi:hypothetical protein quinque_015967 [Culex quinquefasciatus]